MKRIWLFGFVAQIALAAPVCAETRDPEAMLPVRLGSHQFSIPRQYVLDAESSWIVRMFEDVPGLDSSRDILLNFEAQELARAIAGYEEKDYKVAADLFVRLAVLTEEEQERYRTPNDRLRDLWYGTGTYHRRIVEPDPHSSWIKVFREPDARRTWDLLKVRPDPTQSMPPSSEFWVGMCIEIQGTPTSTGNFVSCSTMFLFQDLLIEFGIWDRNLPVLLQVQDFIG